MENIKNLKEIKGSSIVALEENIKEIGMALFAIRSKAATDKAAVRSDVIKKLKKSRARMMTVMHEKKQEVRG